MIIKQMLTSHKDKNELNNVHVANEMKIVKIKMTGIIAAISILRNKQIKLFLKKKQEN